MKKLLFLLVLLLAFSSCVKENPDKNFDNFYDGSAGIPDAGK